MAATTPDSKCVRGGKEGELDGASYFLPRNIENTTFHWPKLNHVTIMVARDAGEKVTAFWSIVKGGKGNEICNDCLTVSSTLMGRSKALM